LFGKLSLLDLGAALVILLVVVGIFIVPSPSGTSVAQVGVTTKPVEVEALVRGLSIHDPDALIADLEEAGKTNIVIRNQPHGEVDVKSVQRLPRELAVPQPDGSVKALPDPRDRASYSMDMLLVLGGRGQVTQDGITLGNNKVKIGTPLELEGETYNFNASTIAVRVLE